MATPYTADANKGAIWNLMGSGASPASGSGLGICGNSPNPIYVVAFGFNLPTLQPNDYVLSALLKVKFTGGLPCQSGAAGIDLQVDRVTESWTNSQSSAPNGSSLGYFPTGTNTAPIQLSMDVTTAIRAHYLGTTFQGIKFGSNILNAYAYIDGYGQPTRPVIEMQVARISGLAMLV